LDGQTCIGVAWVKKGDPGVELTGRIDRDDEAGEELGCSNSSLGDETLRGVVKRENRRDPG